MIIIAVTAAELLNQALWQRVYSAKDISVVKKGLISSSIMTFPMTIVAASLGLIAVAMKMDLPHPSIATALVSHTLLPEWASMLFVMVIVLAATSTGADSLAAFSSTASLDIIKSFFPSMTAKKSVSVARIATIIFGVFAMIVAFQAPSILKLLLFADLVAAAAVVPVIAGLYKATISGKVAATGTILGMIAGLPLYFMNQSLYSFLAAIFVSTIIVFASSARATSAFDFNQLKEKIKILD